MPNDKKLLESNNMEKWCEVRRQFSVTDLGVRALNSLSAAGQKVEYRTQLHRAIAHHLAVNDQFLFSLHKSFLFDYFQDLDFHRDT